VDEVAISVIVNGRPPELPGVESIIGPFINTLPLRVRLPRGEELLSWLRELQARQLALGEHEQCAPEQVRTWSEVPPGVPLCESLYVFENYPLDGSVGTRTRDLGIRNIEAIEAPFTPFDAVITPGPRMQLSLYSQGQRFDPDTLEQLPRHWQAVLEAMLARPGQRLEELPDGEERMRSREKTARASG
jgi:non-ribosomal peptide synthetase component F